MAEVWSEATGLTVVSDIEEDSTPADVPVCVEPGCGKPVRRAGRGYSQWCLEHAREHVGEKRAQPARDTTPRSRRDDPVSLLKERRARDVAKTEATVTQWLVIAQAGFLSSGDVYCARAVGEEGPPIARALAEVAEDFPMLKKALGVGDKWGALAVLSFHTGRLALMVSVHHNWIPYEGVVKFIVPPPAGTPPMAQPQDSPNGHTASVNTASGQ